MFKKLCMIFYCAVWSCGRGNFNGGPKPPPAPSRETGGVSLSMAALEPTAAETTLVITVSSGDEILATREFALPDERLATIDNLRPGRVTVNVSLNDESGAVVEQGEAEATIFAGETSSVTILLESATGTLVITIERRDPIEKRRATYADGSIVFPEGTQLHFIGAYQGYGASSSDGPGRASVHVSKDDAPVVLALSSYDPIEWTIDEDEGASIAAIILSSYHSSRLVGVPDGVPVLASSWEGDADYGVPTVGVSFSPFWAFADDSITKYDLGENWTCTDEPSDYHPDSAYTRAQTILQELTGMPLAGAQGEYEGRTYFVTNFSASSQLPKAYDAGYCYENVDGNIVLWSEL